MKTPDIAILWKKPDGTSCVVSRRGTTLYLSLYLFGNLQHEQPVDSPREAMDLASQWRSPDTADKLRGGRAKDR